MSENIELFKTRLAQLKVVLERDGKIAEDLFYRAMKINKKEDVKKEIIDILTKHNFKIKKGYISLPSDARDRAEVVREFFRETFDTLVKAYGFDITELVPQAPQPSSALKLFEMEDELAAETGAQAFESTMQALDAIDTSTPLESIMEESPTVDESTTGVASTSAIPAEEVQIIEEVPAEVTEEQAPAASLTEQEAESEVPSPPPAEAIEMMEQVPSPPAKQVPPPPMKLVTLPRAKQPAKPVPSPPARRVPSPPAKPVPSPPAKSVPSLPAKRVPSPPARPVPSPPGKQGPAPPAKPVPPSQVNLAPSPPVKLVPSPKVPKPPAAEISYTFYVCNRCGAEISKMEIKQSGAYLECPHCNFTFSRAEATTIQKKPGGQDKTGMGEPASEEASQGESFNLYADKTDESLVKPSDLFKDREDKFLDASERVAESKQVSPSREKSQRIIPGERLVKPSEYLGQMQENAEPEANATELAGTPEAMARENEPSFFESGGGSELPTQEDAHAEKEQPYNAPPVETPRPAPQARQMPRGATIVSVKPKQEATESQFIENHLVKPSERTVRPSELREIAKEKQETEEKCPHCGSTKFTKIQDRTKIISYNPLLYGSRKKCSKCSFIFD